MTQPPDSSARRFLDDHSTLTLACSGEGGPWAADVYFVLRGRALYYFSSPESRHSLALAKDPRAAATVHGVQGGWEDIRGVQMAGSVSEVSSPAEKAAALTAYLLKFPFVREFLAGAGKAAGAKVRFYRFDAESVLWIDNSLGFGTREEIAW